MSEQSAPGGWNGTTINFMLWPDGHDTVLAFSHCGFAQASDDMATCSTGWAYYLLSLKRYLEVGVGMPHPDTSNYHPFMRATDRAS